MEGSFNTPSTAIQPIRADFTAANFVDIDAAVERLERLLKPHFFEFASSVMKRNQCLIAEYISIRHSAAVHVIGIRCRSADVDEAGEPIASLSLQILGLKRLHYSAFVTRPPPRDRVFNFVPHAETASYFELSTRALATFKREVLALLPILSKLAQQTDPGV